MEETRIEPIPSGFCEHILNHCIRVLLYKIGNNWVFPLEYNIWGNDSFKIQIWCHFPTCNDLGTPTVNRMILNSLKWHTSHCVLILPIFFNHASSCSNTPSPPITYRFHPRNTELFSVPWTFHALSYILTAWNIFLPHTVCLNILNQSSKLVQMWLL